MKRIGDGMCAVLLFVCGTAVGLAQPATQTTTAVPRLVKFSGTLASRSGQPLSGVIGVTFALYEGEQGGAPVWMETQNVQADANGQYSVLLGSTRNEGIPADVFTSGQRWLGVQAQAEAELPRVLMASVPYSLKAADAETLGGLPASAYALAGAPNTPAGLPNHAGVAGSVKAADSTPATGPNLSGTGTTNFIPLWTNSTTLGNSRLFQTAGGNVGLGTTAPAARLQAVTASTTGTALLGSATAATGATFGVYGSTASPMGIAVNGSATSGTGVAGTTTSPTGYGVYGNNSATTGNAFGLYGASASPAGYAVYGNNTATTGQAFGVNGATASTGGIGVRGQATATSGSTYGVYGSVVSPAGIAVNGTATSGTGVAGTTTNPTGYGVYGANSATTGQAFGVFGTTASTAGVGMSGQATATSGSNYGVYGSTASPAGIAVYGSATSGTGVAGGTTSPTGYGVYGANSATTGSAYGVYGATASTAGIGMLGAATAASGSTYGVYGSTVSPAGTAVYGTAQNGGFAGQFAGNVKITGNLTVTGTVSKGGGSFRIDHPLDPQHKYLYHSFVESPDMMNIYNGVVTLSPGGDAVVTLPDWFDALNRDFRYQLTCIGGFAPVYIASEVSGNQFKIGGGQPGMKVSWQVTGIRQDTFANEHRIPVEEKKPPVD